MWKIDANTNQNAYGMLNYAKQTIILQKKLEKKKKNVKQWRLLATPVSVQKSKSFSHIQKKPRGVASNHPSPPQPYVLGLKKKLL